MPLCWRKLVDGFPDVQMDKNMGMGSMGEQKTGRYYSVSQPERDNKYDSIKLGYKF